MPRAVLLGIGGVIVAIAVLAVVLLTAGGPPPSVGQRLLPLPAQAPTGEAARGEPIFQANCARCHGIAGGGSGTGPALRTIRLQQATAEEIVQIVRRGRGTMPAVALTDEDLLAVLAYLGYLRGE